MGRWDTAGGPVESEGIDTVVLTLRGMVNRTLVLKDVYFSSKNGLNLISVPQLLQQRYSLIAHPQNASLPRRGRTVGAAHHNSEDLLILRCHMSRKECLSKVNLAGNSTSIDKDSEECSSMEVDAGNSSPRLHAKRISR